MYSPSVPPSLIKIQRERCYNPMYGFQSSEDWRQRWKSVCKFYISRQITFLHNFYRKICTIDKILKLSYLTFSSSFLYFDRKKSPKCMFHFFNFFLLNYLFHDDVLQIFSNFIFIAMRFGIVKQILCVFCNDEYNKIALSSAN